MPQSQRYWASLHSSPAICRPDARHGSIRWWRCVRTESVGSAISYVKSSQTPSLLLSLRARLGRQNKPAASLPRRGRLADIFGAHNLEARRDVDEGLYHRWIEVRRSTFDDECDGFVMRHRRAIQRPCGGGVVDIHDGHHPAL